MVIDLIFNLIGGLGLFFYGMHTLSEALKKISGQKLKEFLHIITKTPLYGVMVGTFVTTLIQSSSALTVMVVGFVNAGLINLTQAIPVIMGANIGTTMTAWIVSTTSIFNISTYALPSIGIGFAMNVFAKKTKTKAWGEVILGFGLLFIGIEFMDTAFIPLKESQATKDLFLLFSKHPFMGIIFATIFTFIVQSSSAATAILQVLAFNGLITFDASIPLILGFNIGTTITAQLASLGTNINARRSAMAHTLFNVFGVAYMIIFYMSGWYTRLVENLFPGELTATNIMGHIALAHSIFNVTNTFVLLPFVKYIEKASCFLVPQKEETMEIKTQYLEKHLLDTPSVALQQVEKEIVYMAKVASKAVHSAMPCIFQHDISSLKKVDAYERETDNLQSEITQYIIDLAQRDLTPEESQMIPVLIHNVNDLERIGDHSQNISQLIKRKIEEGLPYSEKTVNEIKIIWEELQKMLDEAYIALNENNIESAQEMLQREGKINRMQEEFRDNHILRLNDGSCNVNSGFIYIEIIDNLEKIADRLTNLAQSVIGKMQWKLIKQEE